MSSRPRVDLNCDLGEGAPDEESILDVVTSANVACGFHAGSPGIMRRIVRAAGAKGVGVGAHPGLRDPEGFGRREVPLEAGEAFDLVLYQVGALQALAAAEGEKVRHVKPHGALYHRASRDGEIARAVASAVRAAGRELILVGPPGSELVKAGREVGLPSAEEAFADRGYRADGSLVPRGSPGALIEDPDEAARRAVRIVVEGRALASDGSERKIRADTICVHGDTPGALAIARRVRAALEGAGVEVRRLAPP
ncbi:MAG: LamB/YcsF family protein [Planctomycetota bacterium]